MCKPGSYEQRLQEWKDSPTDEKDAMKTPLRELKRYAFHLGICSVQKYTKETKHELVRLVLDAEPKTQKSVSFQQRSSVASKMGNTDSETSDYGSDDSEIERALEKGRKEQRHKERLIDRKRRAKILEERKVEKDRKTRKRKERRKRKEQKLQARLEKDQARREKKDQKVLEKVIEEVGATEIPRISVDKKEPSVLNSLLFLLFSGSLGLISFFTLSTPRPNRSRY